MFLRSPKAVQILSPADKDIIDKGGLAVVECSWARLSEIPFSKIASPNERLCTYADSTILYGSTRSRQHSAVSHRD
jgi:pre-rRNA-processing protein TSR3